jgi:5-methylcytosine-specific restriction enzyme A
LLHKLLSELAKRYVYERAKPFAQSEFAKFVRHDIALEAKKNLIFQPFELKVKASVGAGNWAAVPWLGYFDPLITESATSGFYVVYLVNPQTEEIFLSLNQGATAVYREFGEKRGKEILRRRAIDMADRVPEYSRQFDSSEIDLGSEDSLPSGYLAGHSFGARYNANNIDSENFREDLFLMLTAYENLVNRGGITPLDAMQEESRSSDIVETRRYILSRRIERSPNVRKNVLLKREPRCEGCGLDPLQHYDYNGPLNNTPLDIHHSNPVGSLAEGESRRYKIPEDFLVLCPTCHRMIHKQNDPSDLEALKSKVRFTFKI